MRKYLVSAIAAVSVVAATSSAQADMAAANKWIESEFQPSTLSKSEQAAEMEWFVNAATPFQGMEINVLSEGIPTHSYESEVLTRAFEEITGIKVNHQILGEGEVVRLLTNRMAPAAVSLCHSSSYSAVGLFDTHLAVALAHCLFNIPLAVWILEGFMQGIPKELDETAFVDGYSFPRFFATIFIPTIKAGVGVAAFFCFMFSWVELLLAKTLTAVAAKPIAATMTKTASSAGYELGLLAAAGTLTIIPGAIVIYFVRNYIAKGFAMGRV